MNRKQLAKENQRLARNIKRRLARLDKKYGEESFFVRKLNKMPLNIFGTRGKSIEELKKQYRELRYLDELKTSYVKGQKNFDTFWNDIKNYGYEAYDKFSRLYNRFVEENGMLEKYKYEIVDKIADFAEQGLSEYEIRQNIFDEYEKVITEDEEVDFTMEGTTRLF